jgi:hypothetical protein
MGICVLSLLFVGADVCSAAAPPNMAEMRELERIRRVITLMNKEVENTAEAKEERKRIANVRALLDKADRVELFELDSNWVGEKEKGKKVLFHGYEVLRHVKLARNEGREVTAFLGKALHWSPFWRAACFNPRHGLRAIRGKETVDFVICFECNIIYMYSRPKDYTVITVLAKNYPVIDRALSKSSRKP